MRPTRAILALLSATLLAGCQTAHEPVAKGKEYFHAFGCARCHRIGDVGAHYGPNLTLVGFRRPADWLDQWLQNPKAWKTHTAMPNLHLPDHVRTDLVAYLSSLQGEAYATTRPWDTEELRKDPVARGKAIFEGAGCVGCHGMNGVGGNPNPHAVGGLIPQLGGVKELYSKDEIMDKVRQGSTPGVDPKNKGTVISMPVWGKFLKKDELEALSEYLYTLKGTPHHGGKKKADADDF